MERYNLKSSLQFGETLKSVSDSDYRRLRDNYDALLKQPLQLGFFVPCDENGKDLKPCGCISDDGCCKKEYDYQKAKEKVLFEGFNADKFGFKDQYYVKLGDNKDSIYTFPNVKNYTIEDLAHLKIELTENAIKQIGLKN